MFALADPMLPTVESPGLDPAEVARLAEGVISWQGSLFGLDDPEVDRSFAGLQRTWLADGCWVDHLPSWLSGSDTLFAELVARLAWRQRRVPMYGRMVEEPRLTAWWQVDDGEPPPLPVLAEVGEALAARYDVAFDSIGFNLYRDGADSVAWHTDRNGRGVPDTTIATVSVGAPRPFLLRPIGGGRSLPFLLGQGDLLVMGGETQLVFEHAVPKVAAAGPRLSIGFRHLADRPVDLLTRVDAESVRNHPASARDRHAPRASPAHGFAKVLGEGSGATGTWPGRR
jgi:alkylated DNA repair dioxygenase AlkB